jgi:hypothetical protein
VEAPTDDVARERDIALWLITSRATDGDDMVAITRQMFVPSTTDNRSDTKRARRVRTTSQNRTSLGNARP